MIIIQTYRHNRLTGLNEYTDYQTTFGILAAMAEIRAAKNKNDLSIYDPIEIYNIYDTEE